jgi:hypothetical protein
MDDVKLTDRKSLSYLFPDRLICEHQKDCEFYYSLNLKRDYAERKMKRCQYLGDNSTCENCSFDEKCDRRTCFCENWKVLKKLGIRRHRLLVRVNIFAGNGNSNFKAVP